MGKPQTEEESEIDCVDRGYTTFNQIQLKGK